MRPPRLQFTMGRMMIAVLILGVLMVVTTDWFRYRRVKARVVNQEIGLVALLSFVAIHGRWRRLTRRINIGLNMALACLILSFAAEGDIFQSSVVDQIARNVLALVAVIYVPSVGVQIYGEIGRLDRAGVARRA